MHISVPTIRFRIMKILWKVARINITDNQQSVTCKSVKTRMKKQKKFNEYT